MADNLTFTTTVATAPSGTVVATDDVGGVHYQLVKLAHGAADSATLVSTASGLPVAQQGTWAVDLGATDNAVLDAIAASLAGTLTVGSHAVTNAGTFAVQAAQSGTWTVDLGATDNAVLDAIAASLAGTLTVGSHAVTNAGTFAVQVTGDALTALQTLDNIVSGNEAQVDVVTQPARAATTDTITAKLATDTIQNGTTALTPKFAYLDTSSSGNQQVVAAVVSKKIRVLAWFASSNGATNIYFRSATAGQISGTKYLTQYGGAGRAFSPVGHFETTAGEALQVNNSAAVAIGVEVVYVEV